MLGYDSDTCPRGHVIRRYTLAELTAWVDMPMSERYGCIDIDERRVIPDIEIREAVINACGLRSIADFQLLTLERRKSVIQEVMRSLDVRPWQLARVTGMNYETIRNIAKKITWKQAPIPRCLSPWLVDSIMDLLKPLKEEAVKPDDRQLYLDFKFD